MRRSLAGGTGTHVHPFALLSEQAKEFDRLRARVGVCVRGAGVELGGFPGGEDEVVLAGLFRDRCQQCA
jgi:hypothetical protein